MNDKKVTESITLIGAFLTMVMQSLIGFEVLPSEASASGGGIIESLMELARNIFALVTVYGVRRKLGEGEGS